MNSKISNIEAIVLNYSEVANLLDDKHVFVKAMFRYKSKKYSKRVYLAFFSRVSKGLINPFDVSKVSSNLCVSERSLYRRLKGEGLSYLNIKDDFRKDYAIHLLAKKEYQITEISRFLGFSNSSAFTQSFKRWFGFTPKEFLKISLSDF